MDAEDNKLAVLARAARARTGAAEAGALRDLDGRTYAAVGLDLPSLRVSAIGVCVAMAVSSGAKGAEAAVVMGESLTEADRDVLREFAGSLLVHRVDPAGSIQETLSV